MAESRSKQVKRELEPGRYRWCGCEAGADPICDAATCPEPSRAVEFELEERTKLRLCGCKHTGNPPYCDGSHNRF